MSSVPSNSPRPLPRNLAWHRDEVLAHMDDPTTPFYRFNFVGGAGSGKQELLQAIADGCAGRGLLVVHVTAPSVAYADDDLPQDRELADLYACAELIGDFVTCIETFAAEHPESQEAAGRASASLKRSRSVQRLHNLAIRGSQTGARKAPLAVLREETESALRSLAYDCKLAVLIDDVHLLDHTSLPDWLHTLLSRVPTRCTVISRRPGSGSARWGHADGYRAIQLRNMTTEEVSAYLEDRHIAFTGDEARTLFALTTGREFAVVTWCDLALDAGPGGFTELMAGTEAADDPDFAVLTERVQLAVDQIPVDVLGYRMPLFALLAVAEVVTAPLIALVKGDTGQQPTARQAEEIYNKLITRRFIAVVDVGDERAACLPRAISEAASQRLREQDPLTFKDMHACAESYQRELVDLEYEQKEDNPFAAWLRFEKPDWVRGVERWLDHAMWLDRKQFKQMKPALAKIYLDAFWWWDDYLRSAATSILEPALRRVADHQRDEAWIKALEGFSEHWVSSWDETVLRADPGQWRSALDEIGRLFDMFELHVGDIPPDPELRHIYILLCQFYGKAHWYAGQADERRAAEADRWLAAAQAACATQDGELDEDNPNGWIASWALLRRAEIWSALDPRRSRGYLQGLDRRAIKDADNDVRVGVAMLIGDLRWQSGDFKDALDVYAHALLISYTYNVDQETRRKAPNLYTKSLYEATISRVEQRVAELERAGELEVLSTGLDAMQELFDVYWERVRDQSAPPARFALPVPPPPRDSEISTLEEMNEAYSLDSQYVAALVQLARSKVNTIKETAKEPVIRASRGGYGTDVRRREVPGSGPVIEAFYNQILRPSFPPDELMDLDELQVIADSDAGSVWLAEDAEGTILGGAVAEWDASVRVLLLSYLAVRPGLRGKGIGGPLYLAALNSWHERFGPRLILAEIEDPAVHSRSEAYGDPVARLRFYASRSGRVLDIPYFQAALGPNSSRVSGFLLTVLRSDPGSAGTDDDTIDAGVLRKFLENYQLQCEGKIATDDQAMSMWRALDRPGGVPFREE